MLQHVLCVLVGKGQEPGADKGADGKDDGIGGDVDGVDTPVEPHWDGRDYECVAIEQGTGLGGDVLVEISVERVNVTYRRPTLPPTSPVSNNCGEMLL